MGWDPSLSAQRWLELHKHFLQIERGSFSEVFILPLGFNCDLSYDGSDRAFPGLGHANTLNTSTFGTAQISRFESRGCSGWSVISLVSKFGLYDDTILGTPAVALSYLARI